MTLIAPLIDELRAVGIEVSVGEHLDAERAVARVPLQSRAVLRAALQCALIKDAGQLATFHLLFDLWLAAAAGAPAGTDAAPLAGLPDAALRAVLRDAIASGDSLLRLLLADEYVRRFAGVEPGRAVAGVRYMLSATQAADLDGIREDLIVRVGAAGGAGGAGGPGEAGATPAGSAADGARVTALRDRLARAKADRAVDDFRQVLQSAVRRALVADRGARAVRQTMDVRLAQDIDISGSSAAQSRQMAAAVAPLAQHLARILARQAIARPSRVSIRGTLRRAMGTGGVPFSIVTVPPRPPRPEIVVLCDMSGSVSAYSRFTLDLLTAMDSRLQPAAHVRFHRRAGRDHQPGRGGSGGRAPARGHGSRGGRGVGERPLGLRPRLPRLRARPRPLTHPAIGGAGRRGCPDQSPRPRRPRVC